MIQPFTSLTFGDYIPRDSQFCVVTPSDQLPPFLIMRASNAHGLSDISVEAVPVTDGGAIDVVALLEANEPMEILTMSDGTDRIFYKQTLPLTSDLTPGRYYIKVSDTVNTWYSRYILCIQCGAIVDYPDLEGLEVYDLTMPVS